MTYWTDPPALGSTTWAQIVTAPNQRETADLGDSYCYPGTAVLMNKLGITNPVELTQAAHLLTTQNQATLRPLDVEISSEGFRDVHRHLYGDLFAWAGEYRTVNLSARDGAGFAEAGEIDRLIADTFTHLNTGLPVGDNDTTLDRYVINAIDLTCGIEGISPFRDGNGVTLRTMLSHWAAQEGIKIDFRTWNHLQWRCLAVNAYHHNYQAMADQMVGDIHRLATPELQRTVIEWGQATLEAKHLDRLIENALYTFEPHTSIHRESVAASTAALMSRQRALHETITSFDQQMTRDAAYRGLDSWLVQVTDPHQRGDPSPNADTLHDVGTQIIIGAMQQHHDTWTYPPPPTPGVELESIKAMHQSWVNDTVIHATDRIRKIALNQTPYHGPSQGHRN